MNRNVITIDVSNIPLSELEDYTESIIRSMRGLPPLPPKTKWEKFKQWWKDFLMYGDFTTLGSI